VLYPFNYQILPITKPIKPNINSQDTYCVPATACTGLGDVSPLVEVPDTTAVVPLTTTVLADTAAEVVLPGLLVEAVLIERELELVELCEVVEVPLEEDEVVPLDVERVDVPLDTTEDDATVEFVTGTGDNVTVDVDEKEVEEEVTVVEAGKTALWGVNEDAVDAEVGLEEVGSSPPLRGASPEVDVELVADNTSERAVALVEDAEVLVTEVVVAPLGVTTTVVEDVRPPPGAEEMYVSVLLTAEVLKLTFC